ncbi:MAG TPA: glycoside hydrolase family 140 protein [Cyclobacteriaceae bacterium]|nr:glycoside hydrolase family 140 protein [Cyclobacteriaceae bacterium]
MKYMIYLFTGMFVMVTLLASGQIVVSENQRFLSTKDHKPFFWLADTDWELFHRLTREEATELITVRSQQGYNVLQAVALAEFNGIRQPNRYGDWPLNNEDPTQLSTTPGNNPDNAYEYDYWDHVDFIIGVAAQKGIYIGLLPTWGDKVTEKWGDGPTIFNRQNAETYARNLATRYAKQWNVIWILGGDRPAVYKSHKDQSETDDRQVWRAMATGIESVLGKDAFITYHPAGGSLRTSSFLQEEPWLDMHAFQSGHGSRDPQPWKWIREDLALKPHRPVLDMEPCYEDHPVNPWDGKWTRASRGYFNADDVRARIYRGVFAGACGVTYGHHHVWQFLSDRNPPVNTGDTLIPWRTALNAEAARQMIHLKNLTLSRPYFSRIEDASMIISGGGSTYTDAVIATRDSKGTYAFIYFPLNKTVSIDVTKVRGAVKKIWWYDPRTGKSTAGKDVQSGAKPRSFTPPKEGKDWVLVIDNADEKFAAPGIIQMTR